jgi:hypothetical protein
MNKIDVIIESKNPEILVVTPLLPEHAVSKITKKTMKRNKTPFFWLTSSGKSNIPTNALEGIKWYRNKFSKLPPYYIMIDRDIELGRNMLDRLYGKLMKLPDIAGYCYATFQFKGHVNADFPAMPFDIDRLVQGNYISSNSLFRSSVIEKVGLVTDDKYKRLLDYAFLLKCFRMGYVGSPEPKAWFIAHSTKDDISAGSQDDYRMKYMRVYEDYIRPLIKNA